MPWLVDTDVLIDVSRNNETAITIPVTESIGRRAYGLLRNYAKSSGLRTFDSLIAATAIENHRTLVTKKREHLSANPMIH